MTRPKQPPKKKRGRQAKGGNQYNVKLTDEVAAAYRQLGDGNLTLGIERGAELLQHAKRS